MAMTQKDMRDLFQKELGRDPTKDEIDYFLKMESGAGNMSRYEMGQALQGTPEGQLRGLDKYANLYSQKLAANDQATLGQAQSQLQGQFRQLGRPVSTGYVGAFAQAAQQLAMNRNSQMAQFYGGGIGTAMNTQTQTGLGSVSRQQGLQDEYSQFKRNFAAAQLNYDKDMDFYNTQRRQGFQSGLIGMGIQTGMGALAGLGMGAVAASDARLKQNIKPLAEVGGLTVYAYDWKPGMGPTGRQVGFLAQEVREKYPDAVADVGGVLHIDTDVLAGHLRG